MKLSKSSKNSDYRKIRLLVFLLLVFFTQSFAQENIIDWKTKNVITVENEESLLAKVMDSVLYLSTTRDTAFFPVAVPNDKKDVSKYIVIEFPVSNLGSKQCRVNAILNKKNWLEGSVLLQPGESDTLQILLFRKVDKINPPFNKMNGIGGDIGLFDFIDSTGLSSIRIGLTGKAPFTVAVGNIKAWGKYENREAISRQSGFFPFIDKYGQFIHKDWPGKVHSDADLASNLRSEELELQMLKGPESFNEFGGWKHGPTRKATGHFRVEKVSGKWWFIDPAGYLFWSNGADVIGTIQGLTLVEGRENYFQEVPADTNRYIDFYNNNLSRKYGPAWESHVLDLIPRRLQSWGLNTYGNWSQEKIFLRASQRAPYTINVNYKFPGLDGKDFKFPDVFDPVFVKSLEQAVARVAEKTANDKWCIGYFIDNELAIRNLTEAVMEQDASGYGKKQFVKYLTSRYSSIHVLNKVYNTKYKNWLEFAQQKKLPATAKADISYFNQVLIDTYYSTCKSLLKRYAAYKLYLGSRLDFHYFPDDTTVNFAVRIAAKYCDVISFNRYRFTNNELIMSKELDKPALIGEFHFGALDRGLPHPGLRSVKNQNQRAESYKSYINQALLNPYIIGVHWFQYADQPFTGRGDGENYQIGLVDVCDTPYPEMIKALRSISYIMYEVRYNPLNE
jgi:hypothetical protein